MPSEARVDANHVRVTSDDGRSSALYEVSALGPRVPVEVTDHHRDGTSSAYEPASCLQAFVTGNARGAPKK